MPRQDHAVFDDHVGHLEFRVEEPGVLLRIGEIRRGAAEDAAVVFLVGRLGAVRVRGPVELPIDEIDAAGLVTRVRVHRHQHPPVPGVGPRVIHPAQPVAFVPVSAIDVPGAGVEGPLGRMIRHRVNVPADDRIGGIAEERPGLGALLLEMGIPPEGIGDLDRLPAVGRVVDVHRHRPAEHVAVVPPHEHLRAIDVPGVDAVERMEIPAGLIRILRRVREVIAALAILDDDLPVRLEIVGAQEQLLARGEEDVPVLQEAAEGDVLRVGKRRAVGPGPAIVLRQKDLPVAESEGLVVALRIDVGPLRRQAIPEVVGFTGLGGGGGAAWRCQGPASRRPWPPRRRFRGIGGD